MTVEAADIMTLDEAFAKKIIQKCHSDDTEMNHANADDLILQLLLAAGFAKSRDAWLQVDKWYA